MKDSEKIISDFLTSLGIDLTDEDLKKTPERITKMFKNELLSSLNKKPPTITTFNNVYDGMVFIDSIEIKSICSHHFLPFFGTASVAYIPTKKIIGISKINRIVDYFCRKPQVQENLTSEIHNFLKENIDENLGVAVYIEAHHTCMSLRGVKQNSLMKTSKLSGAFIEDEKTRSEFYSFLNK